MSYLYCTYFGIFRFLLNICSFLIPVFFCYLKIKVFLRIVPVYSLQLCLCTPELNLYSSSLQCNNHEIRPGKHIGVCISVANNRLFVGSIPKSKTKEQIVEEFSKVTGKNISSGFKHFIVNCRDFLVYLYSM